MHKQAEIDLVKLEVLGCISENEIENLRIMEETDENFPWKELAEYQNIVSLLPSVLMVDGPSPSVKDNMVRKLNRSIFGADADNELEIIEIKEDISVAEPWEKRTTKDNVDWGSLSVSESLPLDTSSFQEVKTKKSIDSSEFIKSSQITEALEKADLLETSFYKPKVISEKISSPPRNIRKYVFASIIFIVATVSVLTYYFTRDAGEVIEFRSEVFTPVDNTASLLELVNADKFIPFVIAENVNSIKEEIKTDEKRMLH